MSKIALPPASLWMRIKAFAWDYLLIAGYLLLAVGLGVCMNLALPQVTQTLFAKRVSGQVISFTLVTLPITLCFALLESSSWMATWGKRKVGLQVIRADGNRLSFPRSLGRTLLKFIPWELSHTLIWQLRFSTPAWEPWINAGFVLVWLLIAANIISLWLSKQNQTLYDLVADSYVVDVRGAETVSAAKLASNS
jgi:uncharacterized RDD family membrane protein YckC